MNVLEWWRDNELGYAKIADLASRRLCAQALSATSECAFSNVGLIVSKKRQQLMVDHVDGIILMGWHYKDNGRGKWQRDPGVEQKGKEIGIEVSGWIDSCSEIKRTWKGHAPQHEPCVYPYIYGT